MKRDIIFLGCTSFSEQILIHLYSLDCNVKAVFSIPEHFSISYSKELIKNYNYKNLSQISINNKTDFFEIKTNKGERISDYKDQIKKYSPDIIIVAGWYFMIPKSVLEIPRLGTWGLHASLLPNYAGGAPLVWSLINGEKITGVTLFKMESGVDNGDIIGQDSFNISETDTIRTLLNKSLTSSKNLLTKFLNKSKILFKKQNPDKIKVFPQRKPEDGLIDWSDSVDKIDRFIRAQTKPYPGAWTIIHDKKVTIWDAKIEKND